MSAGLSLAHRVRGIGHVPDTPKLQGTVWMEPRRRACRLFLVLPRSDTETSLMAQATEVIMLAMRKRQRMYKSRSSTTRTHVGHSGSCGSSRNRAMFRSADFSRDLRRHQASQMSSSIGGGVRKDEFAIMEHLHIQSKRLLVAVISERRLENYENQHSCPGAPR
jgi:hypothetical protein